MFIHSCLLAYYKKKLELLQPFLFSLYKTIINKDIGWNLRLKL
jgi:hypothetical protein